MLTPLRGFLDALSLSARQTLRDLAADSGHVVTSGNLKNFALATLSVVDEHDLANSKSARGRFSRKILRVRTTCGADQNRSEKTCLHNSPISKSEVAPIKRFRFPSIQRRNSDRCLAIVQSDALECVSVFGKPQMGAIDRPRASPTHAHENSSPLSSQERAGISAIPVQRSS